MIKALFICKIRLSYGNSYGLLNSASFVVSHLNSIGFSSKLVSAEDANVVDRLITENDPLLVVIEALWITPAKLNEIMSLKRHSKRIFIIRLHSRSTFIANEGIAFEWLHGYRELGFRNLIIAPNNEEFAKDLKELCYLQSIYLPNIYNPPDYTFEPYEYDRSVIKIGCFGAVRPMKNHLTQALAAIRFAKNSNKDLEFHINSTRMEQQGDQVVKNVRNLFAMHNSRYRLIEHDWLSHKDFVQLIRQMDYGLQVSLTETFNIIAADFVNNDISLIGSQSMEWLPSRFQVQNPNSTTEIVQKLEYCNGFLGYLFSNSAKKSLEKYNKQAKKIWFDFVSLF